VKRRGPTIGGVILGWFVTNAYFERATGIDVIAWLGHINL
jgi:hypothetical protein